MPNRISFPGGRLMWLLLLCVGPRLLPAEEVAKILFEENFAADLAPGWSWVRESPPNWKLDKEQRQLHIHAMPGVSLFNTRTLTNILLREPPAAGEHPLAFEVHLQHRPINGYETGGLIWYFDDDNCVQFNKELMGNKLELVMGRKSDGKSGTYTKEIPYEKDDVDMRLVVLRTNVKAQFRASADVPWQTLGETELVREGKPRIGLRAGHGPANQQSWARFSRFRVLKLAP